MHSDSSLDQLLPKGKRSLILNSCHTHVTRSFTNITLKQSQFLTQTSWDMALVFRQQVLVMWLYSIRKRIPLTVAEFSYHVGKLFSTEGDLDVFCHLPISLLSIYPREMCTHLYQETCTCRFITLVVIAKKWRPFKCLTIEQWTKCYETYNSYNNKNGQTAVTH